MNQPKFTKPKQNIYKYYPKKSKKLKTSTRKPQSTYTTIIDNQEVTITIYAPAK